MSKHIEQKKWDIFWKGTLFYKKESIWKHRHSLEVWQVKELAEQIVEVKSATDGIPRWHTALG